MLTNKQIAEKWARRLINDSIREQMPLITLDPGKYFYGCIHDATVQQAERIEALKRFLGRCLPLLKHENPDAATLLIDIQNAHSKGGELCENQSD